MSEVVAGPQSLNVTTSSMLRSQTATMRLQTRYGFAITIQTRGVYLVAPKHRYKVPGGAAAVERILREANDDLALYLQNEVVKALERGRIPTRRGVSTGRLKNAIMNRKNVIIRPFGFGVGVPSWLDRSQAKYWRQIDEGTRVHVNRPNYFVGIWGASATGRYASGRTGRWMVPGGPYTPTGQNRSGKFLPMRMARNPRSNVAKVLGDQRGLPDIIGFRITKPIAPQDYFAEGWRAANMEKVAVEVLRTAIERVLGIDSDTLPKTMAGLQEWF